MGHSKRKNSQQAIVVKTEVLAEGEFNSRLPIDVLELIFSYLKTPEDLLKAVTTELLITFIIPDADMLALIEIKVIRFTLEILLGCKISIE